MPSSHRAAVTAAAVFGAAVLTIAILATTGLIVWDPSVSADILLYNVAGVLLIAALTCHIGCRIYHRCAAIERRQAEIERQQRQVITELRQIDALLQVLTAQASNTDVDRLVEGITKRIDDITDNQWSEGFAAAKLGKIAPLPRTPIGRG